MDPVSGLCHANQSFESLLTLSQALNELAWENVLLTLGSQVGSGLK